MPALQRLIETLRPFVYRRYLDYTAFGGLREMKALIDGAAASRPDGLVVSVPDDKALGPAIKSATAAHIPVILIDSGSPSLAKKLGALYFMGQPEFGAGIEAGRRANMPVLAAAWGYLGRDEAVHDWDADAVLAHPEELLNWLGMT